MSAALRCLAAAGCLLLGGLLAVPAALGQVAPAPLQATLFFKEPVPPGLVFAPGVPITLILQVENTSGAPMTTTAGFADSDLFRRLYFVEPGSGIVSNVGEASLLRESRPIGFCQSRGGVIARPAAIAVLPLEILAGPPTPFVREYEIDARALYDLSRPGRYTVDARIPLLTVQVGDPAGIITDCDDFPGVSLVNIGAAAPSQQVLVRSNALEFTVGGAPGGDATPPELASACAPPGRSPLVAGLDPGGGIGSIVRAASPGGETYTILDLTGNRLQATFEVRPGSFRTEFSVRQLDYGTGPATVTQNTVNCKWTQDRGSGALTYIQQEILVRGAGQDVEVRAIFESRKSQTQIVTRRSDGRVTTVIRPGLVLPRLTTERGRLAVEF